MSNFNKLVDDIEQWAEERGILKHSTPQAQLLKSVSELGELCDAEIKSSHFEQTDAVGDVLVCLIIYCCMKGHNIERCLGQAYEEIKNRKGRMSEGGAFVKEQEA